ncbi:MAG TPA: carboxypeptidase-like regulatory domain-containing protein, partial [Rhodothermales bacterium]|nr:carboxypeptidase-like regulatory domain-containing protein [Rhodothermales bacterium]
MKTYLPTLFIMALLLVPGLAVAQTATVTGQVTDSQTGETLPGTNLLLVELARGAAADVSGMYEIADVPAGTYTLRASFVGYRQQEQTISVTAGQELEVNIALQPDYTGLEEVVVTGIASSTSKTQSTVSVGRVDAEKLTETNTYQDLSQLVGGKIAGVNVLPSSGNVGGGVRFNIRGGGGLNGDGQPVIYVDGVRMNNSEISGFGAGGQGISALADLNPEEIASIDFLKGPASTAIYGTEGANGVVIITTKRGSIARRGNLSVRYKGSFGYNENIGEYSETDYESAADANALFREGDIRQHTLSLSGGGEAVSFFASVDNRYEEGIIPNNEGERTTFRANFNAFPSEQVTLKASVGYTLNNFRRPDNDNDIFGFLGNTLLFPTSYQFTDSLSVNALDDRFDINRFVGSLEGSYSPMRNLEITGTFGYDASKLRQDRTFPQNRFYSGRTRGERNIFVRENDQYNGNVNVRYRYDITPGLNATSIVGGQFFDQNNRTFSGTAQDFSTDLVTDIGTGSAIQGVNEDFLNARQAGLYIQQQVSYNNTYFLEGILRRDFASAIGADASSITYPSLRGSVRFDQFDFVPEMFDLLKFRAAYGEAGNLPNLDDVVAILFQASPSGFGAGSRVGGVGNTLLVPERVREIEVGLDTELFSRLSVEASFFRTFSDDSIIEFTPAPSTGFGAFGVERNVGQINGKGVEFALGVTPVSTRQFQVDFNTTYAYQTTEVQ